MSGESPADSQGKIVVFGSKQIRRTWHEGQWFFCIADVVAALTDSADVKQYIKKMRRRDPELDSYWGTICTPLRLPAPDGRMRETNCAHTEGIFRIIQSIPSPKAEPFKRWLARVGYQRVQEIENPELAQQRMKRLYQEKGYPPDWIEKRMRSIAIRDELTDEWKQRGIKEQKDFAILTAEISKATFGLTPTQYKDLKRLDRENLRDHMTDLELIFTMLGEAATTEIARNRDAQGFDPNKEAAHDGGTIAGNARRQLEHKSGRKVVTRKNYLPNRPKGSLPKQKQSES